MSLSRIFRDDFFNPSFEGFLDFPQSRRGQTAALTATNNQDQLIQAQQMMKLDVSETPTEYKGRHCMDFPSLNPSFSDDLPFFVVSCASHVQSKRTSQATISRTST